jgi:hypothetical protein
MTITKLALTEDQLFALASAVDIALDDIYHTHANGDEEYCTDTAKHLEGLQAILGERIIAVVNK